LDKKKWKGMRSIRRQRVGLNIAQTQLHTLQFDKLQSRHLACIDIGTINHSREFIRGFVESMTTVMDRRINEYVRAIDPITGRKRVFAFMADKVTELHRTSDAVALRIMTEKRGLKVVFADYLLVTGHSGEALMGQIYDETFVNNQARSQPGRDSGVVHRGCV